MPEFIFIVNQAVEIPQLQIKGRVIALFYDGIEHYKIRYFDNCTAKSEYFYADELKPA